MSFKEKHQQIFTVGLTGGIGAGKSTVGRVFETLGIPRFDADKYAHQIYVNSDAVRMSVIERFGEEVGVFNEAGVSVDINRSALASKVFNSEEDLKFLNELVHPAVRRGYELWAKLLPSSTYYAIREAAILFESGADQGCDMVINVEAKDDVRIERVMIRDEVSEEHIRNRMAQQLSNDERKNRADFTIFNNPNDLLLPKVIEIHEKIKNRS